MSNEETIQKLTKIKKQPFSKSSVEEKVQQIIKVIEHATPIAEDQPWHLAICFFGKSPVASLLAETFVRSRLELCKNNANKSEKDKMIYAVTLYDNFCDATDVASLVEEIYGREFIRKQNSR